MAVIPEHLKVFYDPKELANCELFLKQGYIIQPVEDLGLLKRIQLRIAEFAADFLKIDLPADVTDFLNIIHTKIPIEKLNPLRLHVINSINNEPWLRPAYYALGRQTLAAVVGNELSMQRRINLSVQLPQDTSSLLTTHADVWSGDSPYEIVMWLPLVDCYKTKSMYLMDFQKDALVQSQLSQFNHKTPDELFKFIEPDVTFLDIPFGYVLLFSQNIMHGNRVNVETETRWSMNCRFKSALSPYADKKLGEFFEPITLRPATRFGAEYVLPGGFHE